MDSFDMLTLSHFFQLVEEQEDTLVQFSDRWLSKQREQFAADAKAILVQREGHCLPYDAFVGEYHRFAGKQLVLAEFGCKTLSGILQKISSVVRVENVQVSIKGPFCTRTLRWRWWCKG